MQPLSRLNWVSGIRQSRYLCSRGQSETRRDGGAAWAFFLLPRQDGMVRDDGHTWLPDCGALADVHKSACIRHRKEEEKARGLTTSCSRRVGLTSNASPASDVSNLFFFPASLSQRMRAEPGMSCFVTHISRTGSCMQRGWRGAADYRVLCFSFTVVVLWHTISSLQRGAQAALRQRQLAGRASCHSGS